MVKIEVRETEPEKQTRIEALRAASRIVAGAASNYSGYGSSAKPTLVLAREFLKWIELGDS